MKVYQRRAKTNGKRNMTIQKALHRRDDVDSLYASKKKEQEDVPALKTIRLESNIEKRGGTLTTDTRNNTGNMRTNRMTITRKRGARGVIVIVVGNEHGDPSSNPGLD